MHDERGVEIVRGRRARPLETLFLLLCFGGFRAKHHHQGFWQSRPPYPINDMPPKTAKFCNADKMSPLEKKKQKLLNKAKANPERAAKNKEKSDAKRERRLQSGSTKPK
jgi:hypothetical protein